MCVRVGVGVYSVMCECMCVSACVSKCNGVCMDVCMWFNRCRDGKILLGRGVFVSKRYLVGIQWTCHCRSGQVIYLSLC